jgi:glycosyltransferase involved in cell wall biosynthesis
MRRSPRLKQIFRHLFLNRLVTRVDCLHVLTEKEELDVARVYPDAPTVRIPNFVATETDCAAAPPVWWERALDGREVFLFLGRLHEKKGCGELLEAWESVSTADPVFRDRYELVFCGWSDGADAFLEDLENVRRRLGNVRYVGAQFGVEKGRTFAASRFFILPSKSEGLPMAVLEAWESGLLVIMTAQCNLSIGFARGAALETGTSRERIAESLVQAAHMRDHDRQAITAAGKTVVKEFFSQDAVTTSMLRLYADIKAGRGANGPSRLARRPRSD